MIRMVFLIFIGTLGSVMAMYSVLHLFEKRFALSLMELILVLVLAWIFTIEKSHS